MWAKKVSLHLVFICTSAELLVKGARSVLFDLGHITPQQTFTPSLSLLLLNLTPMVTYRVHKVCQRCKNNVGKHNPEHTDLTKRIKDFSVSNQICQSSFSFMPAKNHISKHINHLIMPNQLFHCTLKSRVPLTKRKLACLSGFSQLILTPLALHDACFPSRILSVPS